MKEKFPKSEKDRILTAQKRYYSNQSDSTKEIRLSRKDTEVKPGTDKLKDQPSTKWRGDDSA